jgi:hypothetical protein
MERFSIRVLQNRKRIRLKEISAPSMDEAQNGLITILYQYLHPNQQPETNVSIYHVNNGDERKFRLIIGSLKYSIHLKRVDSVKM